MWHVYNQPNSINIYWVPAMGRAWQSEGWAHPQNELGTVYNFEKHMTGSKNEWINGQMKDEWMQTRD